VGKVLPAQGKKLATDAFKLVWAGSRLGAKRLVIAVVDTGAQAYLSRTRAWLTAALADSGVEIVRVSIDAAVYARIVEAQRLQMDPSKGRR